MKEKSKDKEQAMKKLLVCLGLMAALWAPSASAWQPTGWVYMDWPWAYDNATGDWFWFKTDDVQWIYGYPPEDGWMRMGSSGMSAGWRYVSWPFVYDQNSGAWFYVNEPDNQRVVNMRTGIWSRFGRPPGMVLIPGGTNAGTDPDFGAYSLTVASFYMDRHEVTKALWDDVHAWALSYGYGFDWAGSGKASTHPVQTLTWYDGVKWCNARSEKEGRTPCYTVGGSVYRTGQSAPDCGFTVNGYRLPTNTEWEYAARGGASGRRFPWADSDEIQHSRANYYSADMYSYDTSPTRGFHPTYATGNTPYTSPVGSFAANGYGLYDMAGNVREWCNDGLGADRSLRGGSWGSEANERCGTLLWYSPTDSSEQTGFRTVCR